MKKGLLILALALLLGCEEQVGPSSPEPPAPLYHVAVITWNEFPIVHDIIADVDLSICPPVELEAGKVYKCRSPRYSWGPYLVETVPGLQCTITALEVGCCHVPGHGDTLIIWEL